MVARALTVPHSTFVARAARPCVSRDVLQGTAGLPVSLVVFPRSPR